MTESMTLAIDVGAIERFANPGSVIEDAKEFATHVGVISAGMGYQSSTRLHQLGIPEVDFLTRVDREGGLTQVKSITDTDRYVFIGSDVDEAELAIGAGWEYLDVTIASDEAGWNLR